MRSKLGAHPRTGLRGRVGSTFVLALVVAAVSFCWAHTGFACGTGSGTLRLAARSTLARRSAPGAHRGRIPRASRGGEAAEDYAPNEKVTARSPDDDQWYPAAIDSINEDGTFTVRWDDPDGGPETNNLSPDSLKKIFKDYAVGNDVQAVSADDGQWYTGTVAKANSDGTFQVKWDDPDGGPESADVEPAQMRMVKTFKDYKVGEVVEAVFPDDGQMYPGTITKANDDGTFQVKWDDSDGGPEESACKPKDMKYPPIPFDKLEVGQKYTGEVKTITSFGAFVDIGAESEGLLHISRIAEHRVDDVNEFLEMGQQVDVWISGVRDDGKFGLTMIEGKYDTGGGGGGPRSDVTPFMDVPPSTWLTGTVERVAPFGAFVRVTLEDGPSVTGLVHITQIKDGFVESVEDELPVGQEVQVRVTRVDVEASKISLSMKAPGGSDRGFREPADLSAFEGIGSDQWLNGKVVRTAPFGAFVQVTLDDGTSADGLVHITQISDNFVESVEAELEPDQDVRVRITSVDTAAGKMSLSMKEEAF